MPNTKRFWNWQQLEPQTAELVLYGDIAQEDSWWGDTITPKEFSNELDDILKNGVKNIIVRINSGGGDVFAANAIYCRLKDSGANVTAKIDGWAGSAATIIAMAANEILIPANGVFMVHNPKMAVIQYVEAKQCRKMADSLDTIKNSIVAAYVSKTGKDTDELATLMDNETWYTGIEAVDAGFCDKLMFADDENQPGGVENKAAGGAYFVNSIKMTADNIPEKIKNLFTVEQPSPIENKHPEKLKGEENMEIKNLEDLKKAAPADVLDSLQQEAVAAERKRISDISNNTLAGCEDMAKKAIEDGTSYADFAMQQVEAVKNQQQEKPAAPPTPAANNYQQMAAQDAADAGLGGVNATPQPGQPATPHDEFMAVLDSVAPAKR